MYKIKETLKHESGEFYRALANIKAQERTYPAGSLQMTKRQGRIYYMQYTIKNGKPCKRYLKKSETDRIQALASKAYNNKLKALLEDNIKATNFFIKHYTENPCDAAFYKLSGWAGELLQHRINTNKSVIDAWLNKPREQNTYFPEEYTRLTSRGERVRSIQERDIADALFKAELPYLAEYPVPLPDGRTIFADFAIMHPVSLEIFYWEHFGRLDDPNYIERNKTRIADYASLGILPGEHLIISGSTSNFIFSTNSIERIINTYFFGANL